MKDIGIRAKEVPEEELLYTYESADLPELLPKRRPDGNKGTFGKVLMIAGSKGMAGAAYLGAKAAYRVGADLYSRREPSDIAAAFA